MKDFINKVKDKFVKKEKVAETTEEKRLPKGQQHKNQSVLFSVQSKDCCSIRVSKQ